MEKPIKGGVVGNFLGFRVNGESFDADGFIFDETHEEDCFCCRAALLSQEKDITS